MIGQPASSPEPFGRIQSVALLAIGLLVVMATLPARAEPAAPPQVPGGEIMALTPEILAGLATHRAGSSIQARWSPDESKVATFSDRPNAHIWSAKTGKQIAVLRGQKNSIDKLRWSADGKRIATAAEEDSIRIWDSATGKQIAQIYTGGSTDVAFDWSPDGKSLVTFLPGALRIWDRDGKLKRLVRTSHKAVEQLAWSADGKHIAGDVDHEQIAVWNAALGKEVALLSGHTKNIKWLHWSPDNLHIATGSFDDTVRIWNINANRQVALANNLHWTDPTISWSADGKHLAFVAKYRTLKVMDVSGASVWTAPAARKTIDSVAWSPDGRWIAVTYGDKLKILTAKTGKIQKTHDIDIGQFEMVEKQ